MDPLEKWIPRRIKALCRAKRMSYYQLAKKSGVSHATISRIVNSISLPTMPVFQRICMALDITEAQFFADDKPTALTLADHTLLRAYHMLSLQEQQLLRELLLRADRGWSSSPSY